MMLRDRELLPFAAKKVLHVRDEVVAEDVQDLAFKLLALEEVLVLELLVAADGGLQEITCCL